MMYLTWDEIKERLKKEDFSSPYNIQIAVSTKFACGISDKTAQKIFDRFNSENHNA